MFYNKPSLINFIASPVIQSASCSNIQRTVVMSRFEDPSAAAPMPHSVFRRFRLVSEDVDDVSGHERQNFGTMHSTSTTVISNAEVKTVPNWTNNERGRLEHSQSHGAISQFQQPLKLQVDDDNNNRRDGDDNENGTNCKF